MSAHDNNFNLIRLYAACQVFYNHTQGRLKLPNLGDIPAIGTWVERIPASLPGVPIFFIISGFLVTQSFLSGSGGIAGFFWRRAIRIYPGLWMHYVVILVALGIAGAWSAAMLLGPAMWGWILGAFFIGSDWWGNIVSHVRPFDWSGFYGRFPSGVLWTINAELGFYLLVPIVFLPLWRKLKITWIVVIAFALASLWFAYEVADALRNGVRGNALGFMRNQPAPYFWIFLIGASAALFWDRIKGFFIGKFVWWLAAHAALTLVNIYAFNTPVIDYSRMPELGIPRVLALAGFTLSLAHSFPSIGRPFQRFDLSYAIYLYHMLVVWTFLGFGLAGHWWLWLVVPPIVFAIAAASWFLVEKPAMKLKSWNPIRSVFSGPTSRTASPRLPNKAAGAEAMNTGM
ncbi:MAG: acyltransferase [Amphiplicatus sp.]